MTPVSRHATDAGWLSGAARFDSVRRGSQGLTDRGLVYVVAVTPAATAHPAGAAPDV